MLKSSGVLATRDGIEQHFYPSRFDLDKLWGGNQAKARRKGAPYVEGTGPCMPGLMIKAGFERGKVRAGAAASATSAPERRKWLFWRARAQMQPGDSARQSWLDSGISGEAIEEMLTAVEAWAHTDGAWFVSVQCEMLAWK